MRTLPHPPVIYYVHLVGRSQERSEKTDIKLKLKIKRQDKKPSQAKPARLHNIVIIMAVLQYESLSLTDSGGKQNQVGRNAT